MACSCPVITCRKSSLPEVGADSVLYVDPDQPGEMLQALLDVQDPGQRAELIAKGLVQSAKFSWRNMANIMEAEFAAFRP
jgi:glycosyltransferase involved in cell wall biosynthesis